MPRTYIRKTNSNIDENVMKNAMKDVLSGRLSMREAARQYGFHRATLQSRIRSLKKKKSMQEIQRFYDEDSGNESSDGENRVSSKYTVKQVFTQVQEKELAAYIKKVSNFNYGLTYKQIRELAYEYGHVLKCKLPQNWEVNKIAGIDWLHGFMSRNNDLALRKPESTSLSRSTGFNRARVEEFFENYALVLSRYGFKPEQIYNLDETGITTVMKPVKVVSTKGKKQVGQIASQERGELVTFVGIVNAEGNTIPPIFIYPRIRNPDNYLTDGPISSIALGNKSGWMTSELFPVVLEHIAKHVKCSVEKKILLLLDNHESHTSVTAIKYCRENGIVLLSFPPHTTHKLQPLDIAIFGPFKTKLSIAFNDWMISNPGKVITIREIGHLSNKAFLNSFTPSNIINAFKKPGLWPLNRLAFSESDFMPSSITDRSLENPNSIELKDGGENNAAIVVENIALEVEIITPSTSTQHSKLTWEVETPSTSTQLTSILETVRPLPKAGERKRKVNRKRESKSRIYTDTPEYQAKENLELEKKRKLSVKKNVQVIKEVFSCKNKPTDMLNESSSDSDISVKIIDTSDEDGSEDLPPFPELEEKESIAVGDFLLVQFCTKSKVVYYIGEVINKKEDLELKFLRRKGCSSTFSFPLVDDISMVERRDVISKLPRPMKSATARTSSFYTFNYSFRGLEIR